MAELSNGKENSPNTVDINGDMVLDEGHLCDICSELAPVRANYYQLGMQLGLPAGNLKAIQLQNSHNLDQAFNDMILEWLRQIYDVDRHGLPTWRRLLAAVSSPAGGKNPALAKRIAAKIPGCQREAITDEVDSVEVELCDDDLFKVIKYLNPIHNNDIRRLGLALGLYFPNLKRMENLPEDMVQAWLLKQDNVIMKGKPTWSNLVKALREIGQNGVAQKIEQEKLQKL